MEPSPEHEYYYQRALFNGYLKWDNNALEYIEIANAVGMVAVDDDTDNRSTPGKITRKDSDR